MRNHTEEALAQLRNDHPGWRIWYVVRAVSQPTILWCAKPTHETIPLLHAGSAEELAAQMARKQPPQ